ncbi:putative F-box protein At2g33200 [Abrus precatorius]|uniref:F-box protein At2g33200 n=1 Tax=Abrus precatorius TaxID=3816 RepID=A0A8B8M451_ABRPR|nr:putative F-box protein At2g33200 [Abrus precatorius]
MKNDELWANLHSDLLNQIVKYIHSYEDYARLRLVCKSWSSTLAKTPEHKYPWLVLLPSENSIETYGPREKEINQMRLPQMQNHLFRGSCCGFLVILGLSDGALKLWNPFTKVSFDLPPISTLPNIVYLVDYFPEYIAPLWNASTATIERIHIHMNRPPVHKIIISSPPDSDTHEFMAVVIYGEYSRLGFYRCGDVGWTDIPTSKAHRCEFEDVIFNEGKIYAVDWNAQLYEFDMHTKPVPLGGATKAKPPIRVPQSGDPYDWTFKYLAVHGNGSLLMVVRHYVCPRGGVYRTNTFSVYMLTNRELVWSRVYNIGNYALVLGLNSSISMPCAASYTKPNHIYYTDNLFEQHYVSDEEDELYADDDEEHNYGRGVEGFHSDVVGSVGGHDIGVFDLEGGGNNYLFPAALLSAPVWLC